MCVWGYSRRVSKESETKGRNSFKNGGRVGFVTGICEGSDCRSGSRLARSAEPKSPGEMAGEDMMPSRMLPSYNFRGLMAGKSFMLEQNLSEDIVFL